MIANRELTRRKQNPLNPVDDLAQELQDFYEEYVQQMYGNIYLPIEQRNVTGTYLNHLNEDCLRQIFSEKSLTPMDLCALAETCKLFKRITQLAFPKQLAVDCSSNGDYPVPRMDRMILRVNVQPVERILKHFGSSLVALSVYCGTIESINLIAKHCVAGTLKELEIEATEINETVAVALTPIFQRLQLLNIVIGTIECSTKLLQNCASLVELRIAEHPQWKEIMENNFPNLQRFTCDVSNGISVQEQNDLVLRLLSFFERHSSLKCVKLFCYLFRTLDLVDFLRKFGTTCKELEEFELLWFCSSMQPLDFSNFPNLKKLRCRAVRNIIDDIIRPLTKLEELVVYGFVLSEEEFYKIVKLVKGRPNVLKLKCDISFSQSSESYLRICKENSMVKLIN